MKDGLLNDVEYIPDCSNHSFFEGYDIHDNGDEYVIEFNYGSWKRRMNNLNKRLLLIKWNIQIN